MFAALTSKIYAALRVVRCFFVDFGWKEVALYTLKAALLAAFLTFAGTHAVRLPWIAISSILLIYATIATVGALYYVMVRRFHKQDMFYEGGKFSAYNRKWRLWLLALFISSIFSAFFFVLEAARWDGAIWTLVWVAAFLYGPIFVVVNGAFKSQLHFPYYKSKAIKWSGIIVLIALCLLYAVLSAQGLADSRPDALDALRNPYMPFENAHSAFLSEMDKLSALMGNLTNYGLAQIAKTSFYAAFVVKFFLAFSIFFGMVSQFAFCLLSRQEIKGEFRLLSAREDVDAFGEGGLRLRVEEQSSERPYVKGYFATIALVAAMLFLGFWLLENAALKARATEEYTRADLFVKESTDYIIAFAEGEISDYVDDRATAEKYRQELAELIETRRQTLDPLINAYYDECLLHVDSYVDWSEGILGGFAGYLGDFGEGRAIENFKKRVVQPVDRAELERAYEGYIDAMTQMMSECWVEISDGGSGLPAGMSFAGDYMKDFVREKGQLDLWKPLDEIPMGENTRKALFGTDKGTSKETREVEVSALVEQGRSDAFSSLEEFESVCLGSIGGSFAGVGDNAAEKRGTNVE